MIKLFIVIGLFLSFCVSANDVLFKDTAGQCFQLQAKEVGCPLNEEEIVRVPVQ